MRTALLAGIGLHVTLAAAQARNIEHVVVLMMENRAFDHMLGWLREDYSDLIDGLTSGMRVPVDPKDSAKGFVNITREGYDIAVDDPLHDFDSIHQQINGDRMDGFVASQRNAGQSLTNPVSMFDSKSAPIINTLATEYAVFDKWFCSIPGPTDPNRAFAMSGTSRGMLTNYNGTRWDQQSYLSFLDSHNLTVAGYYQTDLWALGYFADLHTPSMTPKIRELNSHFYDDVAAGKVAQFTWLQPSCHSIEGSPASWQHPDASVMEGERLIKAVYEALRKSPVWEKTLLLITYDEHGGFFDHVAPPSGSVPSPDGVVSPPPQSFPFNQLGVRIPTVAVSPWIKKNTIVSDYLNKAERPTPESAFDATSIIGTVNKMFGIDNALLQFPGRVQWANTFAGLFDDLTEPRKDCPLTLPELPPTPPNHIAEQRAKKLNDHLESQILFYCNENYPALHAIGQCPGKAELFANQGDATDWILAEYDVLMTRRSIAETKIQEKEQPHVIQ